MSRAREGVARWHKYMADGKGADGLMALLAEDAVFHSPVVHTPQVGRAKTFAYLDAASRVLGAQRDFAYVREIIEGDCAMLEFTLTLDGIFINGVDIIRWNEAGEISDFKVMIRPLKAVNKIWEGMAAMLSTAPPPSP